MGSCKNQALEYDERGYGSINSIVCADCFGDYSLKNFIELNGEVDECDYCKNEGLVVELEVIIGKIVDGIKFEYEDANGCMGWDGREGGFVGANTYDTYDLVREVLDDELNIECDDLEDDIISCIHNINWCEKSPYEIREHQENYYRWKDFCNHVKEYNDNKFDGKSKLILETVLDTIKELDLIKILEVDKAIYRVRKHNKSEVCNKSKDIGSAPKENAFENRMSIQGESMFYGADDKNTALVEAVGDHSESITVGEFYPVKKLSVLDLSKIRDRKLPSLFDEENRVYRSPIIFLSKFALDVSKPLDDNDVNKYKPTQIFTKYLRENYRTIDGTNLDGLVYRSSKVEDGICYCLFFDNDQCYDNKTSKNKGLWMKKIDIVK
ncbi:RES domain-containing protein [Clostridium gasigenes]|uniref:HEPN-associated N-terminal domain-containing protein n=1 Tax=Clostridium gasigenes TaxID=94869 RepID=UPI0016253479|nr:HEPN-associated N-terminal domain-containing protein [Clostridium gasigenes]MBB6624812.1 RES domain-containing protein [Clostridium gasigenes]